jgi:hypothetical protein
MLRQLTHLLDDAIPIVAGSEVNDDPLHPLSRYAKDLIAKHGADTPIEWITPEQRYHEKLATPDVTIADLIGEIDMIARPAAGGRAPVPCRPRQRRLPLRRAAARRARAGAHPLDPQRLRRVGARRAPGV